MFTAATDALMFTLMFDAFTFTVTHTFLFEW